MRKIWLTFLFGTLLILGACGNNADSTKDNAREKSESDNINEVEELDEGLDTEEFAEDLSVLVASEKVYLWKEELTDIEWMSYYAMIKNDSETAIDVRNASVTYYNDDDGSVVAVSTQGINIHPYILEPGEIAYVNVYEPAKDIDLNANISTELGIDPVPTTEKVQWLDVEGVNGNLSSTGLKVTGKMTNDSEEKTNDIKIVSGVYDENDELLGVFSGGSDVDIQPGGSSGFELFHPPFPDEAADLAAQYEAAAYWVVGGS